MKNAAYICLMIFFFSCKKEKNELVPLAVFDVGTACRINDLEPLSSGRWIACSGVRNEKGFVSVSEDEGKTWIAFQLDQPSSAYTIDFVDSLYGFCGGDFLHLWRTFDGGKTWGYYWLGNQVPMNEEDRPGVRDFRMWNDSTWYFCGGENLGEGIVYETKDAGVHWYYQFSQHEYRAIFKDENNLIAAGHGSILYSHHDLDGLQSSSFSDDFITDICMTPNSSWLACSYQGAFYESEDGLHWNQKMKANRPLSGSLNWSCMTSSGEKIYAAGADGAFGESQDGGFHWTIYTVSGEPDFWSLMVVDDRVFAGSEKGKIYRIF